MEFLGDKHYLIQFYLSNPQTKIDYIYVISLRMKEVTIKVPDSKLEFLKELMSQLGFEVSEPFEVPDWQIEEVRKRIKLSEENPENLLEWDEVKGSFNFGE